MQTSIRRPCRQAAHFARRGTEVLRRLARLLCLFTRHLGGDTPSLLALLAVAISGAMGGGMVNGVTALALVFIPAMSRRRRNSAGASSGLHRGGAGDRRRHVDHRALPRTGQHAGAGVHRRFVTGKRQHPARIRPARWPTCSVRPFIRIHRACWLRQCMARAVSGISKRSLAVRQICGACRRGAPLRRGVRWCSQSATSLCPSRITWLPGQWRGVSALAEAAPAGAE